VLPPYRIVDGPGHGMLPRTPQNRTRMEAFNIPRCLKIYLTGFIWNSRQCRAGRSSAGKTFQSASPRRNGPLARSGKKECFLSLYLVMSFAEADVGTASSDNNLSGGS